MTEPRDRHIAVDVAGLEAGYSAGKPTITGMNFSIPAGRMVAVLGPNGGGKTTLLRALLGETPYRDGTVRVAGSIAYVPQTERYRLDFPVDALDVVLMGTYAGAPRFRPIGRERKRRATAALERVGLADRAGEQFGELSGGQRQRVLIARALAQEADTILLDEPLSGVDRPSGERILELLGNLRDDGRAVLVSTHDIHQAQGFDEVLCVHGSQVYFGPPAGLTPEVLRETYGGEMIVLEGGRTAVVVQHHEHG